MSVGAALLSVIRTSIYYEGTPVSEEELVCKIIIDRLHTENPTWGARQMSAQLKLRGHHVGRKEARRYMNEMAIDPIYPKPNLSKRLKQAQVVPYLLRNVVIDRPNQAWSIDITYIPMKHGFLYLTAIIDWYSRCIVGWNWMTHWIPEPVWRLVKRLLRLPNLLFSIQIRDASLPALNIKHFSKRTMLPRAWMARVAGQITL